MIRKKIYTAVLVVVSMGLLTGFNVGDIKKKVAPDTENCDKSADPKKCKEKEYLKTGAKVVVIGIAAKIIYDMVIAYNSSQVGSEKEVVAEYVKKNNTLPAEPSVLEYTSSVKPGEIVKAGKEVIIASTLVVLPGKDGKPVDIQEKIELFDNENNKESIKSLAKPVNEKTKQSGSFKNEFKFTLPIGMPQGVYPIKTEVLVNGKAFNPTNNKMQLVLHVDANNQYQIAALSTDYVTH